MVTGKDLVELIAARMMSYVEMPREVRRELKRERRKTRESWGVRWFGVIPYELEYWQVKWKRKSRGRSTH